MLAQISQMMCRCHACPFTRIEVTPPLSSWPIPAPCSSGASSNRCADRCNVPSRWPSWPDARSDDRAWSAMTKSTWSLTTWGRGAPARGPLYDIVVSALLDMTLAPSPPAVSPERNVGRPMSAAQCAHKITGANRHGTPSKPSACGKEERDPHKARHNRETRQSRLCVVVRATLPTSPDGRHRVVRSRLIIGVTSP